MILSYELRLQEPSQIRPIVALNLNLYTKTYSNGVIFIFFVILVR